MPDSTQPAWTTAQKVVERAEPCDIIEVRFEKPRPAKSHFVFNIRKGWCVNVMPTVETNNLSKSMIHSPHPNSEDAEGEENAPSLLYEGFKDAVDLIGLAGRKPCRINNLDEIASTYGLQPRSRKDALQIARAGLAAGAVPAGIRSGIPGDPWNGEDISRQFCLYWKYVGAAADKDAESKWLDKTVAIFGLVLVLLAAVVATSLTSLSI